LAGLSETLELQTRDVKALTRASGRHHEYGFAKDQQYRIVRAEVILPVDAGEFMFYDCAYEEFLQAMGPINDAASVPWTTFNDDVQMGFFATCDQYLLNILYDPRVKPGLTKQQVEDGGSARATLDCAEGMRT
jgi:hypothetical protein